MWGGRRESGIPAPADAVPGRHTRPSAGVEQLDVTARVEPFDNGARVRLVVSQRSDAPDEIRLVVHSDPSSAPIEYCILTATMGNLARTRLLWLKDDVVSSLKLRQENKGDHFAPHRASAHCGRRRASGAYNRRGGPRLRLPISGPAVLALRGVERRPTTGRNRAGRPATICTSPSTHATLTGKPAEPIPGGVASENLELRERFYDGQAFFLGITRQTPAQLGVRGHL